MTRLFQIAFCCGCLLSFLTGCQKGPFNYASILDYAIFNDEVYFLFERVEGIDRGSRLNHGFTAKATRRVFGVAKCSLIEGREHALELVSIREFSEERFLDAGTPLLCSTNSVLLMPKGGETYEVVFLGNHEVGETSKPIAADNIIFNAGRRLLLGCGKSALVKDAKSLADVSGARASELMAIVCSHDWTQNSFAASDDMRTLVIHDSIEGPRGMTVVQLSDIARTTHVALPGGIIALQSVHGIGSDIRIVFTSFSSDGHDIVTIYDQAGKELRRRDLGGGLPESNIDVGIQY